MSSLYSIIELAETLNLTLFTSNQVFCYGTTTRRALTMAATFSLFSPAELSFSSVPLSFSSSIAHPSEEQPLRPDGRLSLQYRDISLQTGVSQAQGALGSAKVIVEDSAGTAGAASTEIWAGVRGEIENVASGQTGGRVVVGLEW